MRVSQCLIAVSTLFAMAPLVGASTSAQDSAAGVSDAPPAAVKALPTVYQEHRFFVAPVLEDGREVVLFTDTGGGMFFDARAAERLELEPLAAAELPERGVSLPPEAARQMGDAKFVLLPKFKEEASVPPPSGPWGESFLLPVQAVEKYPQELMRDGMLGQRWFAGRVWTFDYGNRKLLLRPDGDVPAHEASRRMELGFKTEEGGERIGNFPRMQMVVDGETIEMLFDTGASTVLSEEALAEVGDGGGAVRAASFINTTVFDRWRARHTEWRVIEKADTLLGEAMIEARGVSIAGHEIDRVWFTRREDKNFVWMSGFMDAAVDGAVGGNALRHFRVTVDYPGAVAVFEPVSP